MVYGFNYLFAVKSFSVLRFLGNCLVQGAAKTELCKN